MLNSAPIEIFWISGSPYSWRVLLALAVKQVPYESHLLSLTQGDLSDSKYLQVNPRGRVPGLRHGAVTMGESMTILRYLERCFPEPALFGQNAAQEAMINQQIDEIENYLVPHTHAFTLDVFRNAVAGKEAILNARAREIDSELSGMNNRVGEWLAGEKLSAADIVLYPLIAGILRAAGKPEANVLELHFMPFAEKYPVLVGWSSRVEALPGFETTYPPHWRT